MSEYLPVSLSTSPMQMSNELMEALRGDLLNDFAGFEGGGFRRIKPRKLDFALIENGATVTINANEMIGVLVAAAPADHCVWYAKQYAPGQEPEAPDLVWIKRADGSFPDALPLRYHKKIVQNGKESWGFQICRRTVWVLVKRNMDGSMGLDMDNPYVLDLTSMSMFGKGQPEQNMYKFGGLRSLCSAYCSPQCVITPNMFPIQICLDGSVPVQGVVVFRPLKDSSGMLQLLDGNTIMKIRDLRNTDTVKELLTIREKLALGSGTPVQGATIAQPIQAEALFTAQPAAPVQPAPIQPDRQPAVAPERPSPQASVNADLLAQAQAAFAAHKAQQAPAATVAGVDTDKLAQAQAQPTPAPAAPAPKPAAQVNASAADMASLLAQLG